MKILNFVFFTVSCWTTVAFAQELPSFTYDVGASSGTYNGKSYSEINLGLNWNLNDYLNWRNSAFSRSTQGAKSTAGLDSSLRFQMDSDPKSALGYGMFAGLGYRVSEKEASGALAEGGLTAKLGGIKLGLGAKTIFYSSPPRTSSGAEGKKQDTNVFIILAGGGAL